MSDWSQTWTWTNGSWHEGNTPIIGPRTHGFWLGSTVFDGARGFEGVAPDLDRHCARVNRSAVSMGLLARHEAGEIIELAREGLAKFSTDAAVYIRPMYWAEQGGFFAVPPDPESTQFALCLYEVPMPAPNGSSITRSSFRRPAKDQAPVEAKAACLYPNSARALLEAKEKGFDNALVSDAIGNIAELATANVFIAKDGAVHTPAWNGTFLNGITRQRVIQLLEAAGVRIHQRAMDYQDFLEADEIFSTGNYSKVMPITRIDDREMQPGPLFQQARELYWEFAHSGK